MSGNDTIRPILRAGELHEIAQDIGVVVFNTLQKRQKACHQSCLTCTKFQEAEEICTEFQARPPARVIAYSCPSYNDIDDIPF